MLSLSWRTFRERWQLFLGAILTVAVGVALVQSSLLILVGAATAEAPPGLPALARATVSEGYTAALALLGVTLGIAVFLAVFIVSSTFAFTVAQRRRDLALLRLVGGARRQVRRLLLSEALLLGLIGTAIGIPLGVAAMAVQTNLLRSLGFLPETFTAEWLDWILGVSFGVGVGVALAGVFFAARRAGRIQPLEALRSTGAARRVMTASRWFFGLLAMAGATAMVILATLVGPVGAQPLAINASLAASVGLAALSPLVVPLVGGVFGLFLRGSTIGGLAQANLRDNVRRSAATAAPLLVLVALLIGQSSVMTSIGAAAREEQSRQVTGDLVVEAPAAAGAGFADVPGVEVAATETTVPIVASTVEADEDGDVVTERDVTATAVDPETYRQTHPTPMAAGSLDALTGDTVALSSNAAGDHDVELGGTLGVRIDGGQRALRVVAMLPETMSGGEDYLLPQGVVPDALLGSGPSTTVVGLAGNAEPAAVIGALTAAGATEVSTLADWVERTSAERQDTSVGITTVVMGLGGLYALMAVVNAVVIAAAERRSEFASARVTGLTRGQVVRMALVESWAVTAIGVLLGGLAATLSLIGIVGAIADVSGSAVLSVPWTLVTAVVAGAFAVVGATSVWTSLSATRTAPVALIGARE